MRCCKIKHRVKLFQKCINNNALVDIEKDLLFNRDASISNTIDASNEENDEIQAEGLEYEVWGIMIYMGLKMAIARF